MKRFTTFLLVAAGLLLAAASLNAETALQAVTSAPGGSSPGRDVAETVWFQGYIADQATGDPIDGDYLVTVAIYDAALDGTLIWGPEAHDPVAVAAGWFIVELGSLTPLPVLDSPPYYVELAVDGETFEPRMKLASVPFALRADAAETTDDGDWTVAGPTIYPVSASNLAVGTTSPMAVLHVQTGDEAPLAFFGTPSGAGAASLHLAAGTDSTDGMVIAKVGPDSPMAVAGVPAASKGVIFTE